MTLSTQPRNIWFEVIVMYLAVICAILVFKLLSFIPFIQENLGGIAGLLFLFLPLEWLYRKKVNPVEFGITWRKLGKGFLWAGIFMFLTFLPYIPAYGFWFHQEHFRFTIPLHPFSQNPDNSFAEFALVQIFLVALPEEVFYRGYMQTRLDSVFPKKVRILGAEVGWSVVVTSALFAVGHLVKMRPQDLGTFFPGLVFGWLRAKTGSVGAGVIFHAACNIWAVMVQAGYS